MEGELYFSRGAGAQHKLTAALGEEQSAAPVGHLLKAQTLKSCSSTSTLYGARNSVSLNKATFSGSSTVAAEGCFLEASVKHPAEFRAGFFWGRQGGGSSKEEAPASSSPGSTQPFPFRLLQAVAYRGETIPQAGGNIRHVCLLARGLH